MSNDQQSIVTTPRRIVWTISETFAVNSAIYALRRAGAWPSRVEDGMRQAQEIAISQKDRHRTWYSSNASMFMTKVYTPVAQSGRFDVKSTPVIAIVEAKLPTTPLVAAQPVPQPENPSPTIDSLLSGMIEARMAKMTSEITQMINARMAKIEAKMEENFGKFMTYLDPQWQASEATTSSPDIDDGFIVSQPKPHRKVLVLVNAKTTQQQSIQKEFPQFEIRASMNRVPGETSPELVIGFTKFMNHSLDAACSKKFKNAYIQISSSGAVSAAKQRIKSLML